MLNGTDPSQVSKVLLHSSAWSVLQTAAGLQAKVVHAVVLQTEQVHFSILNILIYVSARGLKKKCSDCFCDFCKA